ncbi:aminotransferase class I/II-fold pyridoxal phosphate-dependent enzyme [Hoylesella buccalis]|uniref:aminotransferase class I/II-fold pyridoxal phosphate-dependent enzyme n=1 Tax=Hoylesella buccalis TaxID=28127 RepID=UPI003995E133
MQAIILAAGMGRRLGSYTKENTKCMVPVNGVRLIDRMLTQLSALHLKRVLMVVGYKGKELIHHIGDRYADALKIEYVENPIYDRTNNIYSLSLVKEQMQEDDTLLIESDLIFSDRLFSMILADERPNIALVAKYETWMDGTMVRIDGDGNIVNFVPKKAFNYQEVDSYYKTVNIYKFSKTFSQTQYVPFLDAYCKALGNNEYYEQVLRVITLLDKTNLKALDIGNEKWYEIDDVQDLDIAETIFAKDDEMLKRYNYRYGGHWRFPKMLDYCYLVNPYFPCKQMKAEMKANFDTLLTEYPSGMYVNSLLAGKCFGIKQEYMVVGNGAAELIKSLMENVKGYVGMVFPTFEEYPHRLRKEQIVSFVPPLETLRYTANDLMNFYEDKSIDMLLLINPDNPSGNFISKADVVRLAAWCKERNIQLVVDESFVDFSDDFLHNSLLCDETLEVYPNLLVMKSISKSYGVPGLRLGILATSQRETIARIKKDVSIWNINSFAEFFMQIYNKYQAQYEKACQQFIDERNRFALRLKEIHFLRVLPTQANYFCCEVKPPYTAAELTKQLLARFDIMIKDCNSKTSLKGLNYIRISIRNQVDNDQLITALLNLQNETI